MHYRKSWVNALNSFLKIMNLKNITTMKKFCTIMLTVLLGGIAAQAQEADYQPLVREGVKWVNHSQFVYSGDEVYFGPVNTYTITLRGDTSVTSPSGTHQYKRVIHSMYPWRNIFMRESEQKVYVLDSETYGPDEEYLLYDFSDDNEAKLYSPEGVETTYVREGTVDINGHSCRVYKGNFGWLVESVGLVSKYDGDMLYPRWARVAGGEDNYGLDHLEDMDGNIIYKAPWYEEPTTCMPLVREGVVWQYAYCIFVSEAVGAYTKVLNIQFKGDTIMNGVNYKKCYLYDSEELPANSLPVYYARENNGKVMFANPRHEVIDTIGTDAFMPEIPGDLFEENGETVVYDFGDMPNFAEKIYAVIESTSEVEVNGMPAKKYHLSTEGTYGFDYVEGVGVDGERSGVLFLPFVMLSTGYGSNPSGLIRLADLDGNTLYEGAYYSTFYGNKYDVNHDGMVDIADINILINVMLGYDVPTGHQGHDTIPAETADKIMDMTGDGHVDITDINVLINKMLSK